MADPLDLHSATNLVRLQLNTIWDNRIASQPTLYSLQCLTSLWDLVIIFHVGYVNDLILNTVMGTLEDLQNLTLQSVTFLFKRLFRTQSVPTHHTDFLPIVRLKMEETFGNTTVVKTAYIP